MAQELEFPHSIIIHIPFPTSRLAETAHRAISVDVELSPLVRRHISLRESDSVTGIGPTSMQNSSFKPSPRTGGALHLGPHDRVISSQEQTSANHPPHMLIVDYRATTNRMLRVAVNGFFESLGVVLSCMRELDVDVVEEPWIGDGIQNIDNLEKVQGLQEQGTIGG